MKRDGSLRACKIERTSKRDREFHSKTRLNFSMTLFMALKDGTGSAAG